MNLLMTGADRPLGQRLAEHFQERHSLRLVGRSCDGVVKGIDLRRPAVVSDLLEGIDAVFHLDVFDPDLASLSEQEHLLLAAQGTFVLMQEARKAGVARVVLASSLALFEAYPDAYVVDESWQPQPLADAMGLAPYMAEITCREFARQGGVSAICLRMAALDADEGTAVEDAVQAFSGALDLRLDPLGYRWHVFHVCSGQRFPMRRSRRALGFVEERG